MAQGDCVFIEEVRVVDPVKGTDSVRDIYMERGVIADVPSSLPANTEVIEGRGLLAVPGFCDLHVHFREPGGAGAETIASGCRAAAHGGFAKVVPMPNTKPPVDNPELVRWQIEEGRRIGGVEIYPSACITVGRQGKKLTDMAALAEAGAVFFTDDGSTVIEDELMGAAMESAAKLDMPVVDHAQWAVGGEKGVMHSGARSAELGMPGIPSDAEAEVVARDIELAEKTGCALHIQHLSAAESVELIRQAKGRGVKVSAEVTPHHIFLCDEDIPADDANYKMNPPLRTAADREALRAAICEGVIDCFASDHAPHTAKSKTGGLLEAPFGVIGLETAIGVTYTEMVATGRMALEEWVAAWTTRPMEIIHKEFPAIEPGSRTGLVLLDVNAEWVVDPKEFKSLSRNTPFAGGSFLCRIEKSFI